MDHIFGVCVCLHVDHFMCVRLVTSETVRVWIKSCVLSMLHVCISCELHMVYTCAYRHVGHFMFNHFSTTGCEA